MIFWQDFLRNPFLALKKYNKQNLIWESLLSLLVFSISLGAFFNSPLISRIFIIQSIFFISTLFIILASCFIDFVAQIFKYKSCSLGLAQRLAISLMPIGLLIPLYCLKLTVPVLLSFPLNLILILIYFLVITLQIRTIEVLYETSFIKSLILYFSPYLTMLFILFFILLSSLLSFIALLFNS